MQWCWVNKHELVECQHRIGLSAKLESNHELRQLEYSKDPTMTLLRQWLLVNLCSFHKAHRRNHETSLFWSVTWILLWNKIYRKYFAARIRITFQTNICNVWAMSMNVEQHEHLLKGNVKIAWWMNCMLCIFYLISICFRYIVYCLAPWKCSGFW